MAETKGEDFGSKSRLDEDDVEGHRRDPEAGPDGYGSKSRESYGSKSRGGDDFGHTSRESEDDVEGHSYMREGYGSKSRTSDEFGHTSRESEDDDVEGHSFSTMRSPSSKGE